LRGDHELEGQIDACLSRHGLPRTPADLGLSEDQFAQAVLHAPSTRPDRYTILEHLDLDEKGVREHVHAFVDAHDR
jgi:glycerol-1-phosphate dehydrogenase [NAD(P)+]